MSDPTNLRTLAHATQARGYASIDVQRNGRPFRGVIVSRVDGRWCVQIAHVAIASVETKCSSSTRSAAARVAAAEVACLMAGAP